LSFTILSFERAKLQKKNDMCKKKEKKSQKYPKMVQK